MVKQFLVNRPGKLDNRVGWFVVKRPGRLGHRVGWFLVKRPGRLVNCTEQTSLYGEIVL